LTILADINGIIRPSRSVLKVITILLKSQRNMYC